MDRGAWEATVQGFTESDMTERAHVHTNTHTHTHTHTHTEYRRIVYLFKSLFSIPG